MWKRVKAVYLNETERTVLVDLANISIEDIRDSIQHMITDPSVDSADLLTELSGDAVVDMAMLMTIIRKLGGVIREQ